MMNKGIGVVTDSTAYLPPQVIQQYGIRIVPLVVRFGEETFAEGLEIDNTTFYQRFRREKVLPKTSQPAVGDFVKVYQELLQEKEAIISIHISGGISGTVEAAHAAAAMLPAATIEIIDSHISCLALGFMVWEAAVMSARGCNMEEILERVKWIRSVIRSYFMVDNLEYLKIGGRISSASAVIGSLLQVKPILHFVEGKIEVYEKTRTKKKAVNRMLELLAPHLSGAKKMRIAVIHADAREDGEEMKQRIEKMDPRAEVHLSEFGPVIGTYLGPGALGVTFYPYEI